MATAAVTKPMGHQTHHLLNLPDPRVQSYKKIFFTEKFMQNDILEDVI